MKEDYVIIAEMIRGKEGFIPFSTFELGTDEENARYIFDMLKGKEGTDELPLQIRLVRSQDDYDTILKTKFCTLNEFTYNCRMITKGVFRLTNFV